MTPPIPLDTDFDSDKSCLATTDPETVMAAQVTNDVVKEAQSVGRPAPIDDTASTTSSAAASGELPLGPATTHTTPSGSVTNATATDLDGANAVTVEDHFQFDDSSHLAKETYLNGDAGDHSATESQAIADASGGSDTDISRPGSVDQFKREPGHVRTGSSAVKKPSTFKSVSVTKNFLAKSAVSTPAARLGDKTAPAAPTNTASVLTAKPRLVAKLGTGNTTRALGKVNGAGPGPDASKVWNKNQPVPPPPPKQFTDEELKQQYGIHLATRLQADESGKEAKWADIDDDEDDWAPETVQWMDGTKSSGAALENEPPSVDEQKTVSKSADSPVHASKPVPVATSNVTKPSVIVGTKTILKPGVHAQPATGKSSLVLKGQPEKPTLVTKPSSSEKKSPWATLPPVEKVPPVQINPPLQQQQQQQQPSRLSQRDHYAFESMPPLLAKEIAPDDFNRSWREDRAGRPELFNSQSGRYEPVNELRRGSTRDSSFRQQPSVLQRPSQDGPAEPSAAFQTSRSGGDMPTWGRRRNSSNVSGNTGRRMSFDRRGSDMPSVPMGLERRGSQSVNEVELTEQGASRQPSATHAVSPSVIQAHPVSPYGSVTSSNTQDLPTPINATPVEDPVEVQKRLMADKIERARQKKQQEQEAEKREEAERKERIAKRLAAMGPPVEKPKGKEQSPARAVERSPRKDKAALNTVSTPPKPPVPTSDGSVAQYGMMKVHQAQPVKKALPIDASPTPKVVTSTTEALSGPLSVPSQVEDQTKAPLLAKQPVQSFDTFTRDNEKSRPSTEQIKSSVHAPESAMPAGPKSHGSQANWQPTAPQPRPWTSQVWGPPQTKDRALGNGTFGSNYDRGQPRPISQPQIPPQPQPVAPVNLGLVPQPSGTQSVAASSNAQPIYSQVGSLTTKPTASAKPTPIAPLPDKGWGNFAAHIAQDDRNMVAKARQDLDRLGGDNFRPEIRETYKDQRGQSQTTLHDKAAGTIALHQSGLKKDDAVKPAHDGPASQQPPNQAYALQQASGPRASRFFPRSTEMTAQVATTASSKMDSPPPPPETETHPAFSGNTNCPLVRLPKPSPVVRLPPQSQGSAVQADATVSMPGRGHPGLGARPLAMNPEWQARFNKLLEKPGSPGTVTVPQVPAGRPVAAIPSLASAKPGSLPVAAASKAALDVRGNTSCATVSLPNVPLRITFADDRGSEALTRKGTEALFEDREFGSLPTVRLSKDSHLAAGEAVVAPPTDDMLLSRFKRVENPFTTRRLEVFDLEKGAQRIDVVIRINNMQNPITRSMQRRPRWARTSNQYAKPKRSNVSSGTPVSSSRNQARKPTQQATVDRPSNSTRPSTTNAWTGSSRSSQATQSTTWARLAAAPVH